VLLEVVIGRSAAVCLHPLIAWPRVSASGRIFLISAYLGAGYLATLTVLFLVSD
jgi:hypothetical protein